MKITIKEQREKREGKTKKKPYSIAKKNVVRDHSFIASAISTNI